DNSGDQAGAAYLFERTASVWSQSNYFKGSNTEGSQNPQLNLGDSFGSSVALDAVSLIVGGPQENGGATGVNGDQGNVWNGAGAAYLFLLNAPDSPGAEFCSGDGTGTPCPCSAGATGAGCPNSTGSGAHLVGTGDADHAADTFGLAVSGLPGSVAGLCIAGDVQSSGGFGNPVGDGLLCL
ncbi:MAG: hypothetical protein GY953_55550, partial [bacterium]|nr:hypothetical protein [bacterium]